MLSGCSRYNLHGMADRTEVRNRTYLGAKHVYDDELYVWNSEPELTNPILCSKTNSFNKKNNYKEF